MRKTSMIKLNSMRSPTNLFSPSNVENHFNYELPVSPDKYQRSGPVSPLKSQSMDDPGLEETGRRESRGERRTVKEKESERRGEDCEMRGERKEKRDIREGAKVLVGGRKMKWGLLWFRRWPVVTSSSARIDCSTRRGERSSDRE